MQPATIQKLAKGKGYQKWAKELTKEVDGETWVQVRSRQTEGWVKLSNLQMNRTLEVNFVDIGAGRWLPPGDGFRAAQFLFLGTNQYIRQL